MMAKIKINKREMMVKAHQMAKQMVGDYIARLALALRALWAAAKKGVKKVMNKNTPYATKEEAMANINTANKTVASKQTEMIAMMYEYDMTVTQNDLDNIALDAHQSSMKKAMSY